MPMTVEQIVREASTLPESERASLIERLVVQFGTPGPRRSEDGWRAVARRRWEEIESGRAETIPGDEVLAEARRLVGR
jgi:putative addiction module component (TIGR02574 family)